MDFDSAFQIFASWQTVVLCLGIYVITYTIRTIVEGIWPGVKKNRLWTELGLPLGPIGTGLLIAIFAKQFPWPMVAANAASVGFTAKAMYAGICGLMSGWAYNRVRAWMKATETTPMVIQAPVAPVTTVTTVTTTPSEPVPPTTPPTPPAM